VSWGKKVLARLKLRGDELVLDAGCGSGRLTGELLAELPRGSVVGVDLSQNMLQSAKEHLRTRFNSGLYLAAADLLNLSFARVFDGVVSTAAFHWVPDHDRLFANLHAVLRPGGWIEAQCGGGPNLAGLRERINALARTARFAEFIGGFPEPWLFQTAEGAAETLHRAGFVNVETSIEAALTVLEDMQQYIEFVSNVILHRHLAAMPREELRADFVQTLAGQAAADDPPFALDYWRLNLSATAG
jgi:trans-aconitate 2-methyltransferase